MWSRGGSRIRTRGGGSFSRGRSVSVSHGYNRSDLNKFAVLSTDRTQDGGRDFNALECGGVSAHDDTFMAVKGKGKRPRLSDGTIQDNGTCNMSVFSALSPEEKLCQIMSTLSLNQSKLQVVENKMDRVMNMNSRLSSIETVILSHDDRLRLLE